MMKSKHALFGFSLLLLAHSSQAINSADTMNVYESYSYEAKSQTTLAIEKMTQVLGTNPTDYFVHLRLGWLFYLERKFKNASTHYKKAIEIRPSSIEAKQGLMLVSQVSGDFESTVIVGELLLKIDPLNYLANQRTISAYIQLKSFNKAVKRAKMMTEVYPTDPIFLEQLAFALVQSGKKDQAQHIVSELILLSPSNEFARTFKK